MMDQLVSMASSLKASPLSPSWPLQVEMVDEAASLDEARGI